MFQKHHQRRSKSAMQFSSLYRMTSHPVADDDEGRHDVTSSERMEVWDPSSFLIPIAETTSWTGIHRALAPWPSTCSQDLVPVRMAVQILL